MAANERNHNAIIESKSDQTPTLRSVVMSVLLASLALISKLTLPATLLALSPPKVQPGVEMGPGLTSMGWNPAGTGLSVGSAESRRRLNPSSQFAQRFQGCADFSRALIGLVLLSYHSRG